MTEQEINRKIAEYMGLDVRHVVGNYYKVYEKTLYKKGSYYDIPDYCHSLDAVWVVEEKLNSDKLWHKYSYALWNILPISPHVKIDTGYETFVIRHATALQCCEAIIKVLEGVEG